MSKKFELVKKYYDNGNWDLYRVEMAVVKNWITKDEFETIAGKIYIG